MKNLTLSIALALVCCLSTPSHATSPAVVQGCNTTVSSIFVQVLTVSCNLTAVGAGHELVMYAWVCGPVCYQPLPSDVTITASDTLGGGGGLIWTSPASGTQQYNGSTSTCNYSAGAHCSVKEKLFYANTGANSGNDIETFTIAYTGTAPPCNCADLSITVVEASNLIASPFDGSNGTGALCTACGAVLTDGTITLPSGVYTPQVTVSNGANTFGYTLMFIAFRGTDTTDLLLASSSCNNCAGYVVQAGWTLEYGSGGVLGTNNNPTIYAKLSAPNGGVIFKKGWVF